MKRIYRTPGICVVGMENENLIATSEPPVSLGDDNVFIEQGNELIRSDRPGLWDDEW